MTPKNTNVFLIWGIEEHDEMIKKTPNGYVEYEGRISWTFKSILQAVEGIKGF